MDSTTNKVWEFLPSLLYLYAFGNLFNYYFGYVILGYYLSIINRKHKIILVLSGITFLISLFITAYGTYYYTDIDGTFQKSYYSYLTPNVLLMAASLFVFNKSVNIKLPEALKKARDLIDNHNYGIYLCHILVLNYLIIYGIDWDLFHPIIGIPLTTISTLIISAALVYLIKKIPLGKYISG